MKSIKLSRLILPRHYSKKPRDTLRRVVYFHSRMKIITELMPVDNLGFGVYFAPLKATSQYTKGGWSSTEYSDDLTIKLGSSAKVFHYAQEIFEGLKAFKQEKGLALFRPQANIRRMTESAKIMAMPVFPEREYLNILVEMTRRLKNLVPDRPGALYLRPAMIGTTDSLGVSTSEDYEFFVIASPVGGYFKDISADRPIAVKVKISEKHVRAASGGTGAAKTGGNYASSLRAIQDAKNEGFSNVLFLDSKERTYLEELGGMNFFAVEDGVLKTPPLSDTILAGITRDSILRLAKIIDLPCKEEPIAVFELVEKIKRGKITETFACGTAATVSAISHLGWRSETIPVGQGTVGPVTTSLFKTLSDIQFGKTAPPEADWLFPV